MHPLARAALLLAALAALDRPSPAPPPGSAAAGPKAGTGAPASSSAPGCPAGTIAELGEGGEPVVCLPLPPSGQEAVAPLRAGRERRLATDWPRAALPGPGEPELAIPRLPDRPASWAHYQLPVDPVTGVQPAALRHEGDRPRGARADGIRIGTTPGTPVRVASLAGQQGAAEVLLVGQPDAASVVTAHRVAEPAGLRTYLVLYGELGRLAPDLARGAALAPGVVIGLAGGEAGAGGAVYLEVRLLHPGLAAPQGPLSRAALCAASAACDPRNVLARR